MKTLEQRKADALEALTRFDNADFSVAETRRILSNEILIHCETITELLQPTPPDGAVEEAVELVQEMIDDDDMCFSPYGKGLFETLIRRATQPKSCDKLVEALESLTELTWSAPIGCSSEDHYRMIMRWVENTAQQALAEHRKGDEG